MKKTQQGIERRLMKSSSITVVSFLSNVNFNPPFMRITNIVKWNVTNYLDVEFEIIIAINLVSDATPPDVSQP